MQYDLYLNDTHVGGISVIGAARDAWVVGHKFVYGYGLILISKRLDNRPWFAIGC